MVCLVDTAERTGGHGFQDDGLSRWVFGNAVEFVGFLGKYKIGGRRMKIERCAFIL